jgi:cytidylate kinase
LKESDSEPGQGLVIAIDGPSGVGKSTISRLLSERIGGRCVDTGAMYRAVALLARRRQVSLDDEEGLARLGRDMEIEFVETACGPGVRLNGEDVTLSLRLPGVSEEASRLSAFSAVRKVLVEKQRALGRPGRVVMEGRDIGTVVFPKADLKIFLEAEAGEKEGIEIPEEQMTREILSRDRRDQTRKVAPLVPAPDATRIDTTRLSPEEVLERILDLLPVKGDKA